MNKKQKVKLRNACKRMVSLLLTVAILAEVTYPTQVFALTGGPGQPEVQSFEPVGTSDMVDLSTGDFNYNIPLLDVEGYPINIAYHGGITMDQEASWVGLGWNINPGVVNRNMRGLPDDFSGDVVTKELNIKPNKTWGVGLMLNAEIYGFPIPVDITQGFNYNNYTGPSISQGISLSHGIWSKGASGASASLGLNSSSDDGLTIQPSVSFQRMANKETEKESKSSLSIGTSINSRAGMKQFTISASISNPATRKMGSYLSGRSGGSGSLQNGTVNVSGTFDLGMPTYTPNITMSMKNHGFSGNFSLGGELYGSTFKVGLSGFFSSQKLAKTTITNQAYGYMYSQNGESNDNALMDFNREKDGTFTENTAFLPITNFTYDTYSVCGQGVGGSYRPFRSDVGHVFDPAGYTTNDDAALTVEVGLGGWVHFGTNIGVTDVNGRSGKWKDNNNAESSLRYSQFGSNPDYESVYFKEANEKSIDSDTAFYSSAGADRLTMPPLDISGKYEHPLRSMGPIKRTKRDKRSQVFSYLKRLDYNAFAVQPVSNTYSARPSHIAEVTTLGTDGTRYVYGIAAYNTTQKEVTFSVGSTNPLSVSSNLNSNSYKEATEGLIGYYADVDNTKNNTRGVDNYFSATTTPAYAHSYLLTSVLSADYIDADNVRGPSDNDYGSYTRFVYKKPPGPNYKWRVPYEYEKATYTEGLKSDLQDDKANYIYGEKELWYLDSVVTKNYVAVFYKSNRQDGLGVKGENGGYDASDSKRMQRLDSIALFSKQDLRINGSSALPVKCVHFEYSYELCGNIPNVSVTRSASAGKLTLKKIYFSYQNSNKARLTPYIFDYHENNPAENPQYNIKAYDRWGNYKPNNASRLGVSGPSDIATYVGVAHPLPPAEFPYVEQDTTANTYAAVWSLKEIQLPSGGKIKITYEADDYAYVQNQPAMQMFRIANYGNDPSDATNYIDISSGNGKFYFKLQEGVSDIGKYIIGITDLYFRCLTKIRDVGGYNHLEYVSGYGTLGGFGTEGAYGWIRLRDINLRDDDLGTDVNPVVKTAIQFSRLYMPKKVWTKDITTSYSQATNTENSSGLSASILNALVNSDFTKNIKDAITGPDEILYITTALGGYEVGRSIVPQKSWIRLNNPNSHKYGGGARVKKIEMSDEWGKMTGNDPETANYGQEYTYTLPNGSSSGVASYEPLPGGDENPYRQPVYTTVKKRATPDERSYQELPIGECFYPSPNVCYSMVTVKNLQRDNVTRHATGKVVHEFYTAKDFPTITSRTNLVHKRGKDSPFSLFSMLKFNVRDYLTAAQGFMIEQNDMHGKPKSQKVYQEGLSTPISSIEYKYKMESYSGGANKLSNKCTVIEKNGNVSVKRIGEFFDMVADFREDKTTTNSAKIQLNLDVIPGGPIPISVPMPWPSISNEKTRFRSATTTKVIQRFGILEETVATDLGSVVATKNLAYDGETGEVLLTATTTNYNDVVYNLRYPAWWYYESMGPAYQNIGFEIGAVFNLSGVCSSGTSNLASYFREGDEVSLSSNIGNIMGWVTAVTSNSVTVVKKDGTPVSGAYRMKVLRSGQRNMTTVDMATLTTLTNPLGALKGNAYENVLQAAAVEFSNSRKTFCDCETTPGSAIPYTSNDYITGKKGSWRPLRSYTHLTGRSHSNYDNNTNIRKDGVFTSYTPFYKWVAGKWDLEPDNWTYVSEVTAFNTIGEELENKDALGRYSSATFGYNQSMALSVAANSMQKEQAFDGFEDYTFRPCADSHFRIDSVQPVTTDAHTGRYSLKVSGGAPKTFSRQLAETCEDVTRCRLIMTVTEVSSSVYNIGSSLGTAPYSYDWKIVSGSPSVSITTAGIRINGTGCEVKVSITDSKGCITTQTIKH